jgi:hypothetical protein
MQFEFMFTVAGPVMAKVWVMEGRYRMTTLVPVMELERLNGKVWGWSHLGKRGAK